MEVVKAMRALITITKKQLFEPALKLTNLLLSQIAIEQFNKKDKENCYSHKIIKQMSRKKLKVLLHTIESQQKLMKNISLLKLYQGKDFIIL